jgi:hypothetical protein
VLVSAGVVKLLAVAPAIGFVVVPLGPTYHWYVRGAVPVAVTLSVAIVPGAIDWLCGCVVIIGGWVTVIVAVPESALPAAFDTRTQ